MPENEDRARVSKVEEPEVKVEQGGNKVTAPEQWQCSTALCARGSCHGRRPPNSRYILYLQEGHCAAPTQAPLRPCREPKAAATHMPAQGKMRFTASHRLASVGR
jgi:hypothetical protein